LWIFRDFQIDSSDQSSEKRTNVNTSFSGLAIFEVGISPGLENV